MNECLATPQVPTFIWSDLSIRVIENGFVVTVGCKCFAFADTKSMFEAIELYLNDQEAAIKKYCKGGKI